MANGAGAYLPKLTVGAVEMAFVLYRKQGFDFIAEQLGRDVGGKLRGML
jgi:hypothetical protein